MKKPSSLAVLVHACLLLSGCGGGASPSSPAAPAPPPVSRAVLETPPGAACTAAEDPDVFAGMQFVTSHPIGARAWGCLLASRSETVPVFDGARAMRFEVRPGDCTASDVFSDCDNDRSRHEVNEAGTASTHGRTLAWETRLFIPPQPKLRPAGRNAMFLTQLNYVDGPVYGTVAYLEVGADGKLLIRTHVGLSFTIQQQYVVHEDPVGRWIRLRYELVSTASDDGRLRVFVDDVLKVDEVRRTLPSPAATNWLKVGIYNAFKSLATEPYDTQVVFFDGLRREER